MTQIGGYCEYPEKNLLYLFANFSLTKNTALFIFRQILTPYVISGRVILTSAFFLVQNAPSHQKYLKGGDSDDLCNSS
jgi:hypothetical protein